MSKAERDQLNKHSDDDEDDGEEVEDGQGPHIKHNMQIKILTYWQLWIYLVSTWKISTQAIVCKIMNMQKKEIVDKNVCDSCNKHVGINCDQILAKDETNFEKKYRRKYLQKLWAMWHLARRHSFPLPDS